MTWLHGVCIWCWHLDCKHLHNVLSESVSVILQFDVYGEQCNTSYCRQCLSWENSQNLSFKNFISHGSFAHLHVYISHLTMNLFERHWIVINYSNIQTGNVSCWQLCGSQSTVCTHMSSCFVHVLYVCEILHKKSFRSYFEFNKTTSVHYVQ